MAIKTIYASAVVLSTIVSGCGSNSNGSGAAPHSQKSGGRGADSTDCQKFIASLPADYFHDWIVVPEDSAFPEGVKIKVFYYGKLIPGKTPVVFFNGGPTGNSWSSYRILSQTQKEHAGYETIPFVYLDQRGTGCSDPYPSTTYLDELPRYALYGSTGIVHDAEAIRKKLIGDAPWKIFGQSYGGMIVHRYAELAPDSIVSASSHGFALTNDPMLTLTERVESQEKVMKAYLAQYPGDEAEFAHLKALLTPNRCFATTDGSKKVCGKRVLSPFASAIGFLDEWAWMHRWIGKFQKSADVPEAWVDQVVFDEDSTSSAEANFADAVIWHDEMNFAATSTQNCMEVYHRLNAKQEHPELGYLNQCQASFEDPRPDNTSARTINGFSQNLILPAGFKQVLASHPHLKFYLYSGEIDPYSPPTIFADELALTKDLLHYEDFPNSGHNGFFAESDVWTNLLKD